MHFRVNIKILIKSDYSTGLKGFVRHVFVLKPYRLQVFNNCIIVYTALVNIIQ